MLCISVLSLLATFEYELGSIWLFLDPLNSSSWHEQLSPLLGCYRLVDYLEGIQKNFDEAAKVLKFNCEDNGHSDSCYKLGAYYVTGKGKTPVSTYPTGYRQGSAERWWESMAL